MSTTSVKEVFLAFREQAEWLQTCFDIYKTLYESDEDIRQLLRDTAPVFFADVNHILIEYVLLQVGRLTDTARAKNHRPNLSINYINELLANEGMLTPPIISATDGIQRYRKITLESRNWLIAHADVQSVLSAAVLGKHQKVDVADFFESLYAYIDEVGTTVGEGPLDITRSGCAGDAIDLLVFLRRGLSHPRA